MARTSSSIVTSRLFRPRRLLRLQFPPRRTTAAPARGSSRRRGRSRRPCSREENRVEHLRPGANRQPGPITARGPIVALAATSAPGSTSTLGAGGLDPRRNPPLKDVPARLQVALRRADVHPVAVEQQAVQPLADQAREHVALDRDVLAGGIRSSTERSSAYMPALISPGSRSPVFSRNSSTSPRSPLWTRPKAEESSTGCRPIVAAAPAPRARAAARSGQGR